MMIKRQYLIVYPRVYNRRGVDSSHSVFGVTPEGQLVNIKLRIPKDLIGKSSSPSISEFARDDRKAQMVCEARENNSAENRNGMLLFTQLEQEGQPSSDGTVCYIARWAYVLANDADSHEPLVGVGRLDVSTNREEMQALESQLGRYPDKSDEASKIHAAMRDPANFAYSAYVYHCQSQKIYAMSSSTEIARALVSLLGSQSQSDYQKSAYIRVQSEQGRVRDNVSIHLFVDANDKYLGQITVEEAVSSFMENKHKALYEAFPDDNLVIVPASRLVADRLLAEEYGRNFDRIRQRYFNRSNKPLVSLVAMRGAKFHHISFVAPISDPYGSLLQMDQYGSCLLPLERISSLSDTKVVPVSSVPVSALSFGRWYADNARNRELMTDEIWPSARNVDKNAPFADKETSDAKALYSSEKVLTSDDPATVENKLTDKNQEASEVTLSAAHKNAPSSTPATGLAAFILKKKLSGR